jgi:preprotein translocase subunit YajC
MTSVFLGVLVQQTDDGSSSGAAAVVQLGILLLIPVAMYFLLIRPQRRRMREQQALQSALAVGDEIVTTSGIYGTITGEYDDATFWVEIDDDVQIRVARAAVQNRVNEPAKAGRDDGGDGDDGDDAD